MLLQLAHVLGDRALNLVDCICFPSCEEILVPLVFVDWQQGCTCVTFICPCPILHTLHAIAINSNHLFFINCARDYSTDSSRLGIELVSCYDQIEQGDPLVCIHVDLVDYSSRLAEHFSETLDSFCVAL